MAMCAYLDRDVNLNSRPVISLFRCRPCGFEHRENFTPGIPGVCVCNWDMVARSGRGLGVDATMTWYVLRTFSTHCACTGTKRSYMYRTSLLLRLLAVTPPAPPTFGRNCCIGLFYLHYMPPAGRSSWFAVLYVYVCCKCRRVAFVYQTSRK